MNTSVDFAKLSNLKVFSSITEKQMAAVKTRNRIMLQDSVKTENIVKTNDQMDYV